MTLQVKICGLTTPDAVEAAAAADFAGFIFFPASVRHLTIERAARLAAMAKPATVAVTVDADDALLESIVQTVKPNWLQLHGKESPERVAEVKRAFRLPVIKAFAISATDDLAQVEAYATDADMFLFDAKPARGGLPGGTGKPFDWTILSDFQSPKPWFLSGGLDAATVEEARNVTGAHYLDVSSRLESAPGVKDPQKIRDFIRKAKTVTA